MSIKSMLNIHNLRTSSLNIIKELENIFEQDIYRSTLNIQMDLYSSEILRFLSNQPIWSSARTVLDLGFGPGDLISNIAKHFPDKFYTGVDINNQFIKIAKEQTKALNNCEFFSADLYDFTKGRYDFVIIRAVFQHLKEPDHLMRQLPNLLQDNSVVVFNDTPNENFINSNPTITTFDDFYNQLEVLQKKDGGNRNCLFELEEYLEIYNFELIEGDDQVIPITTEEDKLKIIQYLILGCSVAKKDVSNSHRNATLI